MRPRPLVHLIGVLALGGCARPALVSEPAEQRVSVQESIATVHSEEPIAIDAGALSNLPGVYSVEVMVPVSQPTHRIIHVRDWHSVPRDIFSLDLRHAATRPLEDEEVASRYRKFLRQVELVQQEQEQFLISVASRRDQRRVLKEGLTPEGLAHYREIIGAFQGLNSRLARVRDEALDARSPGLDRQVVILSEDLRAKTLDFGAVGRLAMRGVVEVVPLDEAHILDHPKSVRPDGMVLLDPSLNEARHDAQVKRAVAAGKCSVMVLGGAHDLSDSVRKLGNQTTEYIQVVLRRCKEITGERERTPAP
jgi:hypothetical protein